MFATVCVASTTTATCCHVPSASAVGDDRAFAQSELTAFLAMNPKLPSTWSPQHPSPAPVGHMIAIDHPARSPPKPSVEARNWNLPNRAGLIHASKVTTPPEVKSRYLPPSDDSFRKPDALTPLNRSEDGA